ncbi:hypothetical protein ACHWQZ_G011697 [Mnemiopsis leidyi]
MLRNNSALEETRCTPKTKLQGTHGNELVRTHPHYQKFVRLRPIVLLKSLPSKLYRLNSGTGVNQKLDLVG